MTDAAGPGWSAIAGGVRLFVRASPGTSRDAVGGFWRDTAGRDYVIVAVQARAAEGAANEAVARALADHFGARISDVTLVRGATARLKCFDIVAPDAAAVAARLAAPPQRDPP